MYEISYIGNTDGKYVYKKEYYKKTTDGIYVKITEEEKNSENASYIKPENAYVVEYVGNTSSTYIEGVDYYKAETVLDKTDVYSSTITNSVAASSFSLDPNNPKRLTMPFSYIATFSVSTPKYERNADGEYVISGYEAAANETLEFYYAIVSMPADEQYTVSASGITTTASGRNAIVQLADQERITVGITQINDNVKPTAPEASSLRNGTTLQTTYSVGSVKVNVVWFGKAYVYTASKTNPTLEASYDVMFSSTSGTLTLPTSSDRKIVYKLYAAIGTVVDNNGTVLTTTTADADWKNGSDVIVAKGKTIPQYQAVTGMIEI